MCSNAAAISMATDLGHEYGPSKMGQSIVGEPLSGQLKATHACPSVGLYSLCLGPEWPTLAYICMFIHSVISTAADYLRLLELYRRPPLRGYIARHYYQMHHMGLASEAGCKSRPQLPSLNTE